MMLREELWCTVGQGHGFRVPADYFVQKVRFYPGMCPECGAIVSVVDAGTNIVLEHRMVDTDRESRTAGHIIDVGGARAL